MTSNTSTNNSERYFSRGVALINIISKRTSYSVFDESDRKHKLWNEKSNYYNGMDKSADAVLNNKHLYSLLQWGNNYKKYFFLK